MIGGKKPRRKIEIGLDLARQARDLLDKRTKAYKLLDKAIDALDPFDPMGFSNMLKGIFKKTYVNRLANQKNPTLAMIEPEAHK